MWVFVYCTCRMKSTVIVLFRTYSYQFVNFPTHFHTGYYNLTRGSGNTFHVVNIYDPSNQTYTVTLTDKTNTSEIGNASNTAPANIPFEWLKPCTNYTVRVNGCEPNRETTFTSSSKCFTLAVKTYSSSDGTYCTLTSKKYLDT